MSTATRVAPAPDRQDTPEALGALETLEAWTRPRSRYLALTVLCAGMLMIILDGSIVTVALPDIQRGLRASASGLSWVVDAYMITFGGLLLLAGRVGDLVGRRRMFAAGLAVFTAASALCGLATGSGMLVEARFAQGAGGAMVAAVSLGMIAALFPEPAERAKAFGVFGFVGAGGASLGQVLGGVLTQTFGWNWIFLVNLPIGLLALVATRQVLAPERGAGLRQGVDVLGALLVTAGLMLGVYAVLAVSEHGWASLLTLGAGGAALALLAGFVLRQSRAAQPLLPLRIFASRAVVAANLVQGLMVAGLFGFQVLIALYLQNVQGYGAARTGLAMLPSALSIAVVSLALAARAIGRFGERAALLSGLATIALGLAWLVRLPAGGGSYLVDVLPTMVSVGGFGLAITALTTLAMSGARAEDAGLASGLFNTTQQVGAAVGVAVLGPMASTHGFHLAFGVGTGLVLAALAAAVLLLRKPRAATGSASN